MYRQFGKLPIANVKEVFRLGKIMQLAQKLHMEITNIVNNKHLTYTIVSTSVSEYYSISKS